jgi:alpha-L-fucosidase
MKRTFSTALTALVAGVLSSSTACAAPGESTGPPAKFEPTWESLKRYTVPEWYKDAKFGIFIHWGVYSVPAFGNEWYPRNMYKQDAAEFKHHQERYGPQSTFGYKDFIPQFKAGKFNADEWAALFKRSGAQYVVPVAEHHDGFAMYDCGLSEWNAARMGPGRDVVGELAKAARRQGLAFGLSSHRAEHWWFFNEGMKVDSDVRDGRWNALYGPAQPEGTQPDAAFLDNWLARTCELVDKYQPQIVWFDWWIEQPAFAPCLRKFAAYYYNRGIEWGRGVAINYKNAAFPPEAAVLDIERGKLDRPRDLYWQTDTSISVKSWGYIENDHFRSVSSLVHELVDIVSKNGCLLLNVGPKSDGTIPEPAQEILLGIGDWLRVNGEAIYGTRPWVKAGEGPTEVKSGSFSDHAEKPFTAEDIRFTVKGNAVYAVCLGWPQKTFRITSFGAKNLPDMKISAVSILGVDEPVKWSQHKNDLTVKLPRTQPCQHAYTIKIVCQRQGVGEPKCVPTPKTP